MSLLDNNDQSMHILFDYLYWECIEMTYACDLMMNNRIFMTISNYDKRFMMGWRGLNPLNFSYSFCVIKRKKERMSDIYFHYWLPFDSDFLWTQWSWWNEKPY
jgi:hypothetical protein